MTAPPDGSEWDTSALPDDRRGYLDSGRAFDEILKRIVNEARVLKVCREPVQDRSPPAPKKARRIEFLIAIEGETGDLFYNAPDGLRGRYWQGPDIGSLATKHIIQALLPTLLEYTEMNHPDQPKPNNAAPMNLEDIKASLTAQSAKVWPRERDDKGNDLLKWKEPPQLWVKRWADNESTEGKGGQWRGTPAAEEIEIKGALLGPDGDEYVPEGKRDRSFQIHWFGFA